jgi:hypothetical protein
MPEDDDTHEEQSPQGNGSRGWTAEGIRELEASGEWFADRRWREPGYIANSPFTPYDHEEVFGALERVYTPSVAKRIMKRTQPSSRAMPRAVPPLFDPWASHASPTVRHGFDLAVVKPWEIPGCRDMLNGLTKDPANYAGARLELEVHAALLRAGVPVARGGRIDLRAHLGSEPMLIEVRHVEASDVADRELRLLNYLMYGWVLGTKPIGKEPPVPGHVILLPSIRDLPATERKALDHDTDARRRLREKVLDAAHRLVADDGDSTVIDGIVKIQRELAAIGNSVSSSGYGLPLGSDREAQRLRRILEDKREQVRRHADGDAIVWLDVGMRLGEPDLYAPRIEQWLAKWDDEPGRRIVGVVLAGEDFTPGLGDVLTYFWRIPHPRLRPNLGSVETWDQIWCGLNWYRLHCAAWRHRRSADERATVSTR